MSKAAKLNPSASTPDPSKQPIESVGWVFWLVIFFVAIAPSIYLCWRVTYEGTTLWAPAIFGVLAAALIAGVFSWIVNSILQRRVEQRRKTERRQTKKKKKRQA